MTPKLKYKPGNLLHEFSYVHLCDDFVTNLDDLRQMRFAVFAVNELELLYQDTLLVGVILQDGFCKFAKLLAILFAAQSREP